MLLAQQAAKKRGGQINHRTHSEIILPDLANTRGKERGREGERGHVKVKRQQEVID